MWSLLAQGLARGVSLWEQKKATEEAFDDMNRRLQVNKQLAAEQLAITYNSILSRSMQLGVAARRKVFSIKQKTRAVEGEVLVQQAQLGATGKRVDLARDMAIKGGAEREMAYLEADTKEEQDNLIERADMEERAMVNRLISNQPDALDDNWGGQVLDFTTGIIGDYSKYKSNKDAKKEAIILG